jgi:hypothetical protein
MYIKVIIYPVFTYQIYGQANRLVLRLWVLCSSCRVLGRMFAQASRRTSAPPRTAPPTPPSCEDPEDPHPCTLHTTQPPPRRKDQRAAKLRRNEGGGATEPRKAAERTKELEK